MSLIHKKRLSKMKNLLLSVLISAISYSAVASDGNDLYEWGAGLDKTNDAKYNLTTGLFLGYLAAVDDLYKDTLFCPPSNMSKRQQSDIVMKYLKEHPEERALSAMKIVNAAMFQAFPCKKY